MEREEPDPSRSDRRTLSDSDIVTERAVGGGSFLRKFRVLLIGATALATGCAQSGKAGEKQPDGYMGQGSQGLLQATPAPKEVSATEEKGDGTDVSRFADHHLADAKHTPDTNSSDPTGDFDPDSDMRTWADRR